MSASLQQLYAIEEAVEPEIVRLITTASPSANVYLEFFDEEKKTPFIEVRITDLKPSENRVVPLSDGTDGYDLWEGTLVCRIVTTRGENSKQQGSLVGWLRGMLIQLIRADAPDSILRSQLPYHAITQMVPIASPRGHDIEFDFDISELHFLIKAAISFENF